MLTLSLPSGVTKCGNNHCTFFTTSGVTAGIRSGSKLACCAAVPAFNMAFVASTAVEK